MILAWACHLKDNVHHYMYVYKLITHSMSKTFSAWNGDFFNNYVYKRQAGSTWFQSGRFSRWNYLIFKISRFIDRSQMPSEHCTLSLWCSCVHIMIRPESSGLWNTAEANKPSRTTRGVEPVPLWCWTSVPDGLPTLTLYALTMH